MESKILKNVRFQNLYAPLSVWKTFNPIILPGELALVKDDHNRMKIKIGTGMSFIDTAFMYSMDRWTSDYTTLTAADDANIKPADNTGYNTEDFLQISGDLLYPINLTTSVRLKDGSKLQTWMDNVKTGNVTMTGNLTLDRGANGGEKVVLKIEGDNVNGTSISLGSGGNTVIYSGESIGVIKPLLNLTSENLYLASDSSIFLHARCDTASEARNIVFNGTAFYPGSNKNIDLGATSYRWNSVYANFIDIDTSINVSEITLKNNATATFKGIKGIAGNDYWRIGGALSNATNQDTGYLEIATADNGSEPIYVRQYNGNFTTLTRTLTLLDGSGNSQFPGNISEKGSTLENKYLQRSGTLPMTGNLDMGVGKYIAFRANSTGGNAIGMILNNYDTTRFAGIGALYQDGIGIYAYIGIGNNPWNNNAGLNIYSNEIKFKNKKVWWEDNDGANSGLDADLLDGKHASAFSLTSHTHNYAGSASVAGPANSALKFQTARKIGNASFDGTANITLAQIGASPVAGSTSLSTLASTITLGNGSAGTILQGDSNYRQKIEILDDSAAGTDVFRFSQSEDGGSTWKPLFSITDGSTIKASQFTGNSATATKLQTIRKIGNANFDGTANITVAQIGAAPTVHTHTKSQITDFPTSLKNPNALTISVNGVSQGSYDGSAAKSINITPDNIGSRPAGAIRLADGGDLNTTITEGEYYARGSNGITNKPSDVDAFGLRVQRSADGHINQILFSSNTNGNKIYIRGAHSLSSATPVWTDWDMLYTTRYKPTPADIGALALTGGTITNPLSIRLKSNPTGGSASGVYLLNALDPSIIAGQFGAKCEKDEFRYLYIGTGSEPWVETNALTISTAEVKFHNNKVWHAGNDGSGSSLDADLLDGKHANAFSLVGHNHEYVYNFAGTGGQAGYILFAQLKIANSYQNTPIRFEISNRGQASGQSQILTIQFSNSSEVDPTLQSFKYYGADLGTYVYKVAASTWNLYCRKSEAYDAITITRLSKSPYNKIQITWKNEQVTTLPSGYITSSFYLKSSQADKLTTPRKIGNANFDGTANITAAQMGVAPANLIYKNISIAPSAWNTTTKIYQYANASITANHVPQVFFTISSLEGAGKAGITVYTEAGKLVLKCTTIPTVTLVIETAILTPV